MTLQRDNYTTFDTSLMAHILVSMCMSIPVTDEHIETSISDLNLFWMHFIVINNNQSKVAATIYVNFNWQSIVVVAAPLTIFLRPNEFIV